MACGRLVREGKVYSGTFSRKGLVIVDYQTERRVVTPVLLRGRRVLHSDIIVCFAPKDFLSFVGREKVYFLSTPVIFCARTDEHGSRDEESGFRSNSLTLIVIFH